MIALLIVLLSSAFSGFVPDKGEKTFFRQYGDWKVYRIQILGQGEPEWYVHNGCTVVPVKEGVWLMAKANWNDGILNQEVKISKNNKTDRRVFRKGGDDKGTEVEGYDIFKESCAKSVRTLPPKIQELFLGFY